MYTAFSDNAIVIKVSCIHTYIYIYIYMYVYSIQRQCNSYQGYFFKPAHTQLKCNNASTQSLLTQMYCSHCFYKSTSKNTQRQQIHHNCHRLVFEWPEAAPLPDKTALGVADFLFSLFCRHSWPERVISDQGREFVNEVSRYGSLRIHNAGIHILT